eukprot:m.53444 g.53444  ORF g.53444 m.53444 type:complete len:560 (-) comp12383_c0_seq2:289-1968(-)
MTERDDLPEAERGPTVSFFMKQLKVDDAEAAAPLLAQIEACAGLQTIETTGNTYGLPACEALATCLRSKAPTLRHALLDDMFTRRKIPEIHPSLTALQNTLALAPFLTYLDLSDNALNPGGAEAISPLISNCLTLKVLRLNNTGVGPSGGQTIGEALFAAYQKGEREGRKYALERFVLGRSRLERDGSVAIAKAIKAIGSLVEIRINNNGIYEEGSLAIAAAVARNPKLEVLDLSDNALKRKASLALAESLKNCFRLKTLILETCLLRDTGGLAIVKTIGECCASLETLDLSYNEMTVKVAKAAATTLAANSLTDLRLNGNEFGDSGLKALQSKFPDDVLGSFSDNETSGEEQSDEEETEPEDEAASETTLPDGADALSAAVGSLNLLGGTPQSHATALLSADNKASVAAGIARALTYNRVAELLFELSKGFAKQPKASTESAGCIIGALAADKAKEAAFFSAVLAGLRLIKAESNATVVIEDNTTLLDTWKLLLLATKQGSLGATGKGWLAAVASDQSIDERAAAGGDSSILHEGPYFGATAVPQLNAVRRQVVAACQ